MAFAPMGPEASFFAVVDRHKASLLATLSRGGGEPAGGGTRLASSSEVLASIESVIQDIITSVARNEAPAFAIDNRSSWENIKDIYYTDSQLFGNQTVVDNIINDISCMLKVPRMSLHILSTSKGLIAGNLRYMEEDGTRVHCTCGSTAVAVPSNIQGIQNLITDAKFLLIVEKDATFQRLLDDNFCNRMSPCIMVTGKGVPDLNTRLLVKKLWDTFHIPVFALVDADPHGIEIMCIYKYGSKAMSFEAHNLTVPAIRWLGLLPSDIKRLNIPRDTLIPLTKRDQMKLDSVLKRPYITCQPFWRKEMEIMADSKVKAEIQALTFLSSDYLSRVYLPNKLKFGGWI
ncbi:meiotic recombination protein SPO11 isoform X2 [Zalophus californianus]|uniref:DNA topoisomerase (ATP-hydrolyzing) n=1 Tax=Zalophus californianus TaxID=9704 RepID=A0A6J2FEW2_ZALCA|nr:meiotic recombination protein SPO11 isoform X2 [Zalophus californianus]